MNAQSTWGGEPEFEPVRQDLDLTGDLHDRSRNAPLDVEITDDPKLARKQRIRKVTRKALRTIGRSARVEASTDLTADAINPTPTEGSRPIIVRRPEPTDTDLPQPDEPAEGRRPSHGVVPHMKVVNMSLVGVPATFVTTGSIVLTAVAVVAATAFVALSLIARRRR